MADGEQTTMNIRISRELRDAFEQRCAQLDRNKSQVVRDLVREFLSKTKQPKLPL